MNINNSTYQKNISFQRQLTAVEKIENRAVSDDAKKAIGLDNLVLITHTPSFPSSSDEDTGIGVLSKNKGTLAYINFAYDNAIDGISIEPMGIIKGEYYSPYDSSVLSKKTVIDLKALTEDEWANILDEQSFELAVQNKDYIVSVKDDNSQTSQVVFDSDRVIYDYALDVHQKALKTAFSNFQIKVMQKNPQALKIAEEFEVFKEKNDYYLRGDAIYSLLCDLYQDDHYQNWPSELHRTLFDESDQAFSPQEKEAEKKRLEKEYAQKIEFYKFSQFVVDKQQKELSDYAMRLGQIKYTQDIKTLDEALKKGEISEQKYNYLREKTEEFRKKAKGVNIIGDKQIGYSSMDIWSNPSIFTKDEYMGAPPNLMKNSLGQDWNFSFIPREKLFNEDGSLAEGGKYLKKTIKKAFEDNPGGLRIDHILGMIDPWTYHMEDPGITPVKFLTLLLTSLKSLNELNITPETIKGLEDPLEAITNPQSSERKILEQRGVTDFEQANKIISQKVKVIEKVKYSNAYSGRRYLFKKLLDGELKDLRALGFNEQTISGVIDPVKGILSDEGINRQLLEQRGIKDFDEAANIILSKKDILKKEYSKILQDIVLQAGKEVITERSKSLGLDLSDEEIDKKTRSLLICEDLGAITIPLKWVMDDLELTGMRNAAYSQPHNPHHIYREINPEEQGHYWLIGTHDSLPYEQIVKSYSSDHKSDIISYISEEIGIKREPVLNDNNPFSLVRAKVARIFAADNDPKTKNNVMLNWLDLFASKDTYNIPGLLSKQKNWNLRIAKSGEDFEKTYYEQTLPQKRGINIPEELSIALHASKTDIEDKEALEQALKKSATIMEE